MPFGLSGLEVSCEEGALPPGGLCGTLKLSRWLDVLDCVGDMTLLSGVLCAAVVLTGNLVSGPLLRSLR